MPWQDRQVCIYNIHQNVKLMIISRHFRELTTDWDILYLNSYKIMLLEIMYKQPTELCYLQNCDKCPGAIEIGNRLNELYDLNFIEEITI